jgi:hypothetical protein
MSSANTSEAVTPDVWASELLLDGATADMSVNGSITAVSYKYTVPAGKTFLLHRMNLVIIDGGAEAAGFGGLAALTNGVLLRVLDKDGAVKKVLNDGLPLKRHSHFGLLAGIDVSIDAQGSGDDTVLIRFTLEKAVAPLRLTKGESIEVLIQDDLLAITEFYCMAQGGLVGA